MMSQSKDFREHIMTALPIGGEVELDSGLSATVLFHTENMEHELDGMRVKFADGSIDDVPYSAVVAPEWEYIPPRLGRPSQGRSARLQAAITPEQMAWLEEIARHQAKSVSDIVFGLLEEKRQAE